MEHKGYNIKIEQDDCGESPREWDNLGTMACSHKRYNLGDKDHGVNFDDYNSWDEVEAGICKDNNIAIILPIYMYDHSGITINTTGFSCPWDSGQIGFIFVTKETVRKEYGRCTKKNLEKVNNYLEGEVRTYDQFLTGDVYGYTITDETGEEVDSCWGFYGHDYCEEEAKSIVDNIIEADLKRHGEQLKMELA
jgi:hypothetical protein